MIKNVKINREIEITPTVYEIASAFCDMASDEQAEFFNTVAIISSKWKMHVCFQLQSITDDEYLTDEGRRIMELIGEYAPKSARSIDRRLT